MLGLCKLAFSLTLLLGAGAVFASDWQEPWSVVKGQSVEKCAATFQDYQMQAVCMDNEKAGYSEMQGDYGIPHDKASKAKERCEQVFPGLFQLQSVCMKNEKVGYDKMSAY
jgi:hypothetical protein